MKKAFILSFSLLLSISHFAQKGIIDEVIWIIGDEAILKSDVEYQRINAELMGEQIQGDPYAVIPEKLAIEKLFLHQASLDSIEVSEADVAPNVQQRIDYMINVVGSEAKLEEYRNMTMKQIKKETAKYFINAFKINKVKQKIIGNDKVTPSEVRRYFKDIDPDSIPDIPMQVEVQILTISPEINAEEIERIKNDLLDYAQKINSGKTSFTSLARMYSEDEGSARQGGELGYKGRAELVPEFSNVAFALTDPKTVSKIVKTEYGYHIIQLIDRKGDKLNCRHILRKPICSDTELIAATNKLDSISNLINDKKLTFDKAVEIFSDDKDTRNNHGLLVNTDYENGIQTSRFKMRDLNQSIAKVVDKMNVGDISKPFTMINKQGYEVCSIVLLKNRIPAHKANITEDFQILTNIVSNKKESEIIDNWIKEKQKTTYISIKDKWKRNTYQYPGWIK
ncbi:MAG: peptidylprolyl isomerase [Prevotellaceae bacterium]|nr:peptidylprolyl isomerase [Candidatus Faecinaster equi]